LFPAHLEHIAHLSIEYLCSWELNDGYLPIGNISCSVSKNNNTLKAISFNLDSMSDFDGCGVPSVSEYSRQEQRGKGLRLGGKQLVPLCLAS